MLWTGFACSLILDLNRGIKNMIKKSLKGGAILFVAFAAIAGGCKKGEHAEHEHHWSYDGETGPSHWGDLKEEFSACKTGNVQSPIDVTNGGDQGGAAPVFHYSDSKVHVIDNGHSIQSNFDAGSSIELDGKTYKLVQVHFHSPSENHLNGETFAMEGHLVHKADDGSLAVVAIFFKEGGADARPAVAKIWSAIPAEQEKVNDSAATINANELFPSERTMVRFDGSLTTPPCSEGVKWNVFTAPVELPAEQIATFKEHYSHNARPIQPTNGRAFHSI